MCWGLLFEFPPIPICTTNLSQYFFPGINTTPDIPGIGPASIRSVAHCEPSLYSRHWCFPVLVAVDGKTLMDSPKTEQVPGVFFFLAGQPTSPQRTPPRNKALLRAFWPLVSLNKVFTKALLLKGGYVLGGRWVDRINLFRTGLVRARGWFAKVVYLTSRFETMIFFAKCVRSSQRHMSFIPMETKKSTCRSSRDLWSPKVKWASQGMRKTLLVWLLSILLVPFCSLNTFFALAPGRSQKILTKTQPSLPKGSCCTKDSVKIHGTELIQKVWLCWTIQSLWLNTKHVQHMVTTSSWWFQPVHFCPCFSQHYQLPKKKNAKNGFPGLTRFLITWTSWFGPIDVGTSNRHTGRFQKLGVKPPQNGCFIMEKPLSKWDDFGGTTIFG